MMKIMTTAKGSRTESMVPYCMEAARSAATSPVDSVFTAAAASGGALAAPFALALLLRAFGCLTPFTAAARPSVWANAPFSGCVPLAAVASGITLL